jgi:4-hydroxy-tetrahydrodipicolinate synthase
MSLRFGGIHASTIVPMRADFSVDEAALAEHMRAVAAVPGISGLLVNGHAGENYVLTGAEQRLVVAIARAGVNRESSLTAAADAAAFEAAGADALLVFPPNSWALGHADDVVLTHHAHIRDATSLPLMLYGAPVTAGALAYPDTVLAALAQDRRVIGIKDGSWEVAAYEANRRLLKAVRPDFIVLGSGDEHLLASYLVGSDGSQVSLAAVIPETVCALWQACAAGDWAGARALHEVIYPLAVAIYRDKPGGRATARLKACLVILGRLGCDAVRPPQGSADPEEYRRLEAALAAITNSMP